MAWASPITLSDGTNTAAIADIQPAGGAGEVIVSMVTYATFTGAKRLKAQKVGADGALAWAGNAPVFLTGSLQFGAYPSFISDGQGGGIFWWYEVTPLQCRVQRLDADGNALFGISGATVTASASGAERTNPALAFDGAEDLLVVTWNEYGGAGLHGHAAQRFDPADGSRLWGDSGVSIMSLATYYDILGSSVQIVDGAIIAAWVPRVGWGNGELFCTRLDRDGGTAWSDVVLCSVSSDHYPLLGYGRDDDAVFVWADDRSGDEDLYGQNVSLDGVLGGSTACAEDLNGDGAVNGLDLGLFLAQWGACSGACTADLTGDGVVNGADLGLLMVAWGTCGN